MTVRVPLFFALALQAACATAPHKIGSCTVRATIRGSDGETLRLASVDRLAENGWWAAETVTSTTGEVAMPVKCGSVAMLRFGGAMHAPEHTRVLPTDDSLHVAVRLSPRRDLGVPTHVVVIEREGRRSERKVYPIARASGTADIPSSTEPVRYHVAWSSGTATEGTNAAEPLYPDQLGGFESEAAPNTSRISVRPDSSAGGNMRAALVEIEPRCSLTAIVEDIGARMEKERDAISKELGVDDYQDDVSYATAVKHLVARSNASLHRDLRRLGRSCPSQRHVADIASFAGDLRESSPARARLARRILRRVEPTDSAWKLFPGAVPGVVRAARIDADEYLEHVVRSLPSDSTVLWSMLVHADVRGDERAAIAIVERMDGIPLGGFYGGVFTKYRAIRPGAKLPSFAFAGADATVDNATIAGKPAVLLFWASWCAGCVSQIGEVTPILDAAAAQGVTVVAIPLDLEAPPSYAISDRFPASWIKVEPSSAVPGRVRDAFDIALLPVFVLVDADGRIRASSPDVDHRNLQSKVDDLQRAP